MAAQRTRSITFRTMLHILPYHNPLVLAAMIHEFSLLDERPYEFGVGRGHGWIPLAAGLPMTRRRATDEEALDLFVAALHNDVVSFNGEYWNVEDSHIVPFSGHRFRVILGGRPTRRTTSPRNTAGASPCRHSSPTPRSRTSSTSTARSARSTARRPTSSGSSVLHRRRRRAREARGGAAHARLPRRECVAADRFHAAADRQAERGGLRLLRVRDHGAARRDSVRRDDRRRHRVGRNARRCRRAHPRDDRGLRRPHRDRDHDEPRRRRALEGDQGAGAVRAARDPTRARAREPKRRPRLSTGRRAALRRAPATRRGKRDA